MDGNNPRYRNGARRRKLRARLKAQGLPCALCGKPIDYTLPARHPMSFEVDEIVPVSRYREGGYSSPEQCALDPSNLRPAHRICNQRRGNARNTPGTALRGHESRNGAPSPEERTETKNHPPGPSQGLTKPLPQSRDW